MKSRTKAATKRTYEVQPHKYWNLFIIWSLVLGIYVFLPENVSAGTIINRPLYLGLTQGLVGYWSFDGPDMAGNTAYDRSPGNANNGTLTNGPARTTGKLGQGLSFDGVNDMVDFGTGVMADSDAYTISVWYRDADFTGGETILGRGKDGSGAGWSMNIELNADKTIKHQTVNSGSQTTVVTSSTTISPDTWIHITAVWKPANYIKIYFDGVDRGTTNTPSGETALRNSTVGLRAGGDAGAAPTVFSNGSIDDVRIYNRALSENEIRRLYNIGATTKINATPKHQLTNGLVGYWSFDGPDMSGNTAFDRSPGNANNGTLTNGPVRTIGKLGQGLDFDGVNDYIDAGAPASLNNLSQMTISFWTRPDPANTSSEYISKNFDAYDGWTVDVSSGGTRSLYFEIEYGSLSLQTDDLAIEGANNTIELGVWQHIAITWSGGTTGTSVKAYKNGQEISYSLRQNSSGSRVSDSGSSLIMGGGDTNVAGGFKGSIDDVRIYNRALSENEIRRLYQLGATTKINATPKHQLTNGLVGYWTFDGPDMSGNTAYDRSPGNANNGTLTNGPVRAIGKLGQALDFDGTDDYVNAGSGANLDNLSQLSISAWIYPRSFGGTQNAQFIVSKDNLDGWYFYTNTGSFPQDLILAVRYTGTDLSAISPDNSLAVNKWQHVVVTWNGDTNVSSAVDFYVDGNRVGLRNPSGTTNPTGSREDDNTQNVLISSGRADQASNFNGPIDDVRIYNRVLSENEIRRLYQIGR